MHNVCDPESECLQEIYSFIIYSFLIDIDDIFKSDTFFFLRRGPFFYLLFFFKSTDLEHRQIGGSEQLCI